MIDKRLELAKNKKVELEHKLKKVEGTPREEDFILQIEKLDQLIKHLQKE